MPETQPSNPLTAGLANTLVPQPSTLVIFGGGGDLAHRKLIPAVYNLAKDGVLPANFAVVGFARSDMDDEAFRKFGRDGIEKFSRQPIDEATWPEFARSLFFLPATFE